MSGCLLISRMHLYNLTLHKASAVQRVIYGSLFSVVLIVIGNFSSPNIEEFVVSRGNIIELWRYDEEGNISIICSYEVYGLIRSLKPLRLSGR